MIQEKDNKEIVITENPRTIVLIYIAMMIITVMQGSSLSLLYYSNSYARTALILIGNVFACVMHMLAINLIKEMILLNESVKTKKE